MNEREFFFNSGLSVVNVRHPFKGETFMDWRKVTHPLSTDNNPDPAALIDAVNRIYEENGRPKDFYVILQKDVPSVFYFSPVAATLCDSLFNRITRYFEILPCDSTEASGVLVVGDPNTKDLAEFIMRSRV